MVRLCPPMLPADVQSHLLGSGLLAPTACMSKAIKPQTAVDSHLCCMQMCWAIKPEVAEVAYLLQLDKSPTQEEFIRGHMTHNPYTSLEVGPLMRDVKNFVCRELDMEGGWRL